MKEKRKSAYSSSDAARQAKCATFFSSFFARASMESSRYAIADVMALNMFSCFIFHVPDIQNGLQCSMAEIIPKHTLLNSFFYGMQLFEEPIGELTCYEWGTVQIIPL
jgi:hypothetical protein